MGTKDLGGFSLFLARQGKQRPHDALPDESNRDTSHAQIKRLIQQYIKQGRNTVKIARRNGFKPKYTKTDIRLLAERDERHNQPSGPVIKKLCERAGEHFDKSKYERLAGISVSHLYNLRQSTTYQRQRCVLTKTRPKNAPIGHRRKPCANKKQPGYIRIDSMHQGAQDKRKGDLSHQCR